MDDFDRMKEGNRPWTSLATMAEIKRWLASYHGLGIAHGNSDSLVSVIGSVPNGEHDIPIGKSKKTVHVVVKDGFISIDHKHQSS